MLNLLGENNKVFFVTILYYTILYYTILYYTILQSSFYVSLHFPNTHSRMFRVLGEWPRSTHEWTEPLPMIWSAKLPEYLTSQQTFSCYSEGNVPPLPMLPHIFQEHHKRRNLEKSQNIPPNLPILPRKITQLGLGIIAVPLLDEERSKIRLHRPSHLWPSTLEEDKTSSSSKFVFQ